MASAGLTQALAVSATGIITLVFDVFCLGTVVDYFTYLASTLPIELPVFKDIMSQMIIFSQWFYYIIAILGVLFVLYPIAYVIRRHRYMDIEPVNDQQIYQQ
jgi:hypothetical protein